MLLKVLTELDVCLRQSARCCLAIEQTKSRKKAREETLHEHDVRRRTIKLCLLGAKTLDAVDSKRAIVVGEIPASGQVATREPTLSGDKGSMEVGTVDNHVCIKVWRELIFLYLSWVYVEQRSRLHCDRLEIDVVNSFAAKAHDEQIESDSLPAGDLVRPVDSVPNLAASHDLNR